MIWTDELVTNQLLINDVEAQTVEFRADSIDWIVRHAPCDVLLVDNLGYDNPVEIALSGDGGPYAPLAVKVAEAVATANGGSVALWYPAGDGDTDQYRRAISDYESELSEALSPPVRMESVRTDGGQLSRPDLLVRQGADHRLRNVLFDDRPAFPSPGCTTVTAYPRDSRRPRLTQRFLEALVF